MAQRASADVIIEGKYRLERELGAGGMGSVWLATQLMVDRKVAVKLLHPAFIDQDDLQARFEVEAKAIGRLNHPNCITLFDFGYSEELSAFYTVIEYVEGQSLDKRLGQRLALEEIVGICRQIALALDHAHHQGILHRDLKPENVMLARMTDGSEVVKVLDFGIARIVGGDAQEANEDSQRITKAGEVFGTPAYMSPEQARSIRQLTPAADLYALGVILYELVAGELPFFAQSAFDLLMLHVTQPVPPIDDPRVPEPLKGLIYRLMAKAPEERYQSGKAVAAALDGLRLGGHHDDLSGDFEAPATRVDPPPRPLRSPASATTSGELYARNASGEFVLVSDASGQFLARPQPTGHRHPTPGTPNPTIVASPGSSGTYSTTAPVDVTGSSEGRKKLFAIVAIALLLGGIGTAFLLTTFFGGDEGADGAAIATGAGGAVTSPAVAAEPPIDEPTLTAKPEEAAAPEAAVADGAPADEDFDFAADEVAAAAAEVPEVPGEAPAKAPDVAPADEEAVAAKKAERPAPAPRRKRTTRPKPAPRPAEPPATVPKFNLDSNDDTVIPKLGL